LSPPSQRIVKSTPRVDTRTHKAHEAPGAIAALLHLAVVGVENAVAEIGAGGARWLHQQDLVTADAEMPVCEPPQLRRGKRQVLADAVQHDEIVAGSLHLGELQLHLFCSLLAMFNSAQIATSSELVNCIARF
jgi:hypothetical protein